MLTVLSSGDSELSLIGCFLLRVTFRGKQGGFLKQGDFPIAAAAVLLQLIPRTD